MIEVEIMCVIVSLPLCLTFFKESDYINGKNQTEAYQDNEDMENDKNDDTKGKKIFIYTFFILIKNNFIILIANQYFSEIVYHAYHIPFVSLITINLSNNMLAHNSSVLSLICWPSLKNVILTANTISLNKNLIEFKKLMSTLSVFNIKTKR